ncbi:prephenate/arogenate dehydrogenase [Aliterella atlantica]|uniref:Arogenate dehydrogenase n=1 Tax=Aliterella atlantica CENA595 TaxID=1618023 RepID=A0A0D8ZL54_9CYAN|nr:prephenate/arogenate dehydrogenase [Aliterella atlantica]KJH69563.1 arogenate dehydrogenase [Aliterella atlantica CENA595]
MNIGIIGLGLIGGSLGLDLRACGYKVLGVSRREQVCQKATSRGAVDLASMDLATLADAEVIFVCTPIAAILPTVQQLIPHIDPATVLTDVGSVKAPVVDEVAPLWANFVGGHPMAGTADSGIEAAQTELFVSKPYVLTPVENTPSAATAKVEEIVKSIQANIYYCSPQDHDRAVSLISHLPVMVSGTLINTCHSDKQEVVKLAQQLASSGFRDTSRVGGGNPELGMMMARYNRQELLRSLQSYRQNLDTVINLIEQEDWDSLEQQLQSNHIARKQFVRE